jgi:hypothetical protein
MVSSPVRLPPRSFRKDTKQRTGFTVDHVNFTDRPVGWVKEATIARWADRPGTRAHSGIALNFELVDVLGREIHQHNEQARNLGGGGFLPDPEARARNLAAWRKARDAGADRAAEFKLEHIKEGLEFHPYDFKNITLAESILLLGRRQALAQMAPAERHKALDSDPELRRAVLQDASPASSGLNAELWQHLHDSELRRLRPDDVARRRDEAEILGELDRTLETIGAALENEQMSLGLADMQRAPGPRALPEWKPTNEGAA